MIEQVSPLKEKPMENKMGIMSINKLLLSMSLPMMLSMLVQSLYNIVDSIFVSQISENALTAVSLAFPIQMLMISVASGTGVGINALLSKSLGEKNRNNVDKAANNGILLALLSCLLFVVLGLLFAGFYFRTQTGIGEIVQYGQDYLTICTVFSFALFGQVTFERLLQSTGKTVYAMITQTAGALTNIILDPIMIFGLLGFPRLGVAGAAIATVIGQALAMLLAIYFNRTRNHEITLKLKGFKPDWMTIRIIYAVGVPSILMMSIGSVMTYGVNKILISFSSTATAVFGVYYKLQSFVFMPVFGLNNGMIPIISYNYGARNRQRMIRTIQLSVLYAVVIMVIGFALFQIFPRELLLMFNASDDMIKIGIPALRIISISFLFAGFCIIVGSVFQALGNGILSLFVSVGRQLVALLPAAFLLAQFGGLQMVWWAFPIAEIVSVILSALFMRHVYVKEIKPIGEAVLS